MRNRRLQTKLWQKWAIIFICWTAFALFLTSQSYLIQARYAGHIAWKGTLIACVIWSYSWNIVTPFILLLSNRFPLLRGKLVRAICLHVFAGTFFFIIVTAIFIIGRRLFLDPVPVERAQIESFRSLVIGELHAGLAVYFVVVGINQSIDYYRRYRDRELQASSLEARLVTSQLDALRMQLHPHFLFNTLNSISVLMRRDVEGADRMLLQLSNLLRTTLARNAAHEIKLQQELEILERYLEIEQIRFQDRLTVRIHIDPAVLDSLVPQLFFQPLVENAIRHGIADLEIGGIIDIRAERQNGLVRLQVRDNGPGLPAAQDNLIEGVGLSNTRARLDYLYGSESTLEVSNAEDGGLIVMAALPFHTETVTPLEAKK